MQTIIKEQRKVLSSQELIATFSNQGKLFEKNNKNSKMMNRRNLIHNISKFNKIKLD